MPDSNMEFNIIDGDNGTITLTVQLYAIYSSETKENRGKVKNPQEAALAIMQNIARRPLPKPDDVRQFMQKEIKTNPRFKDMPEVNTDGLLNNLKRKR